MQFVCYDPNVCGEKVNLYQEEEEKEEQKEQEEEQEAFSSSSAQVVFPTSAICSAVRSQHLDCKIRPRISSRSRFVIPSRFRISEHNNICLRAAPWRPAKLSGNAESWVHVLTRFRINSFLVSEII